MENKENPTNETVAVKPDYSREIVDIIRSDDAPRTAYHDDKRPRRGRDVLRYELAAFDKRAESGRLNDYIFTQKGCETDNSEMHPFEFVCPQSV